MNEDTNEETKVEEVPEKKNEEKVESNTLQCITEIEDFVSDTRRRLNEIAPVLKLLRQQAGVLSKRAESGKRVAKPKKPPRLDEEGNLIKHGFAAPAVLSNKLKLFMAVGPFEKVPRTTVTRFFSSYVTEHTLRDPEDSRYVVLKGEAGIALRELLLQADQQMAETMLFSDIQKQLKYLIASKAHPLKFIDTVFDDGSMEPEDYRRMIEEATAKEEEAAKAAQEREAAKAAKAATSKSKPKKKK